MAIPTLLTTPIVAFLVLVAAAPCAAEPVHMPGGGPLPTTFVQSEGHSRVVWTAFEGYRPRAQPNTATAFADSPPLKFLEAFHYVAEYDEPGTNPPASYLLLALPSRTGKTIERYVGWIEKKYVVTRPGAELDPASNVPRKVLLVNTVTSLQATRKSRLDEVSATRSPEPTGAMGTSAELLDVVFRYATADGYVLIGTDPRFVTLTTIRGWVPEDLTLPWDTRLAVEWDHPSTMPTPENATRRAADGKVFRNRRDAYQGLKSTAPPLFEEQADEQGANLPFSPAAPRFPIVPYTGDADFPEFDPDTDNQLLKIGAVGAFLDAGGVPLTRKLATEVQNQITTVRGQLASARQILIVIDDTGSMQAHFPRVAKTVERIINDALRERERIVQVAVSYYNDKGQNGTKLGYTASKLIDAREGGTALVRSVASHVAVGGGDFPEMVFEGLGRAIDEAGFERIPRASRLVILIGDHGNRTAPKAEGHPDEAQLVEKLLRSDRAPIEFHAIQVIDPDLKPEALVNVKPEFRNDAVAAAKAFRTQMETLRDLMNRRREDFGRDIASYAALKDDGANLTMVLDRKYDELLARESDLRGRLAKLQAREFHTKVGSELELILNERDVATEKLRDFAGARVGHEGYVWRWLKGKCPAPGRPGVSQVRLRAFISRDELSQLITLLDPILAPKRDVDVPGAIRSRLGTQDDRSFEQVVLRPAGLEARSPLLRQTLDRIPPSVVEREAGEIRRRRDALKRLLAAPGPRAFRLNGGATDFYWIDDDEFP